MPGLDFESSTSANSIIPAYIFIIQDFQGDFKSSGGKTSASSVGFEALTLEWQFFRFSGEIVFGVRPKDRSTNRFLEKTDWAGFFRLSPAYGANLEEGYAQIRFIQLVLADSEVALGYFETAVIEDFHQDYRGHIVIRPGVVAEGLAEGVTGDRTGDA